MLEYSKQILIKVSFDPFLFEKELLKAIARIVDEKLNEFKNWCYKVFENSYKEILDKCFNY